MNHILMKAKSELEKLKQSEDYENTPFDIVLVFENSAAQMKRLTGYQYFKEALESLGGEPTMDNISEACEISHFSRDSVCFDDLEVEDIYIHTKGSKSQIFSIITRNRGRKF